VKSNRAQLWFSDDMRNEFTVVLFFNTCHSANASIFIFSVYIHRSEIAFIGLLCKIAGQREYKNFNARFKICLQPGTYSDV
jgi:hypothetical protein